MSGWRARRAEKKRLKELQKQRVVVQEKCYLCGSLVTVEPGLAEQAIRPAFPDAKGALSRVHLCSACLRRVSILFGAVDGRVCIWLTIPEAERYMAWQRGEKPSVNPPLYKSLPERGVVVERPAAVTQQPSPPPPPAAELNLDAVPRESPEDRLLRVVAKQLNSMERKLDTRLAALERREPRERAEVAVEVLREAQPPPKPKPAAPPAEKPRDIALDIAEAAATILRNEGDMDAPTLRSRLPPEARDNFVWGRVVRRLNLRPDVVVTDTNGVKLFAPKRET